MAAAVLAPLAAAFSESSRSLFMTTLPPILSRSILLQLPTTRAYTSLSAYTAQVANQEGIKWEQAIVHIAIVLSLLAPHLPPAVRAELSPELFRLLPSPLRAA